MHLLTSSTGLRTMTFHTPLNQNVTFDLEHRAPDCDFFIPLPIKTPLLTSSAGLRTVTLSHPSQNTTFDLEHRAPDRDFFIPLSIKTLGFKLPICCVVVSAHKTIRNTSQHCNSDNIFGKIRGSCKKPLKKVYARTADKNKRLCAVLVRLIPATNTRSRQ